MGMLLALALAALAAAWWLVWAYRPAEPAGPSQAAAAPRDPIREEVDRWMHQWVRGRA